MKKEEMYEQELSKLIAENNRLQIILKKIENPLYRPPILEWNDFKNIV